MELAWVNAEKRNTVKQALQWTPQSPQGHRSRRRPKNTRKRDLNKEMWI